MWMLVMKKPKLNLRNFSRFSPGGVAKKQMMGKSTKFHMVNVTKAATLAGKRSEEAKVAMLLARLA